MGIKVIIWMGDESVTISRVTSPPPDLAQIADTEELLNHYPNLYLATKDIDLVALSKEEDLTLWLYGTLYYGDVEIHRHVWSNDGHPVGALIQAMIAYRK